MKVDIAQSIREVLDERQSISLEGLGSLKLVNTPASFGELRKSILPPGVELVFEDTTSSNTPLIENISLNYNITANNAEKYVQKFNETLLNTLANFGKVHILGVGSILRTSGGEINIIPDQDFIGQYYKGLPEIPVRLAPKKKPVESVPISDDVSDNKTKQKEIVQIPGISSGNVEKDSRPPVTAQAEVIDKTEVKPAAILPLDKIDQEPGQQTEELKYLKTNRERGIWWPIFWIALIILLLFLLVKTCGSFIGGEQKVPEQDSLTDPVAIAEQSPNFSSGIEETNTDDALVFPDQCIIVTGVFSSAANVRRMSERLSKQGYVVYREEFGPYTRVGFAFDCDENTDLVAYIQNVRVQIAAKAWYLDPVYYVEY